MTQDCETCRNLGGCESPCNGSSYDPKVLKIAFREFRGWLARLIMDIFGEKKDEDDFNDDDADDDYDDADDDDDEKSGVMPNKNFICPYCGRVVKIGEENYDDKKL